MKSNKFNTLHVRRILAKIRHKGFQIVFKPEMPSSVIAVQGGIKCYDEKGGAILMYANPLKMWQTINFHF